MNKNIDHEIIARLTEAFPDALVCECVQPLTQIEFDKQKEKHFARAALGGAAGIIVTPDNKIVLAKRTALHAGWSLPGGTVEAGEDFLETFRREIVEEIGVEALEPKLVCIERKRFISPTNNSFDFLFTVFHTRIKEKTLPPLTDGAKEEGLEIALFAQDSLPEQMIMGDKEKLQKFLKLPSDLPTPSLLNKLPKMVLL